MCTNFEGKKIFSSSLCVVFITLTKETSTTTTTVVIKLEIFGLERTPEIQLLHHCSTSTVNDHCCSMFTLSDGIIICLFLAVVAYRAPESSGSSTFLSNFSMGSPRKPQLKAPHKFFFPPRVSCRVYVFLCLRFFSDDFYRERNVQGKRKKTQFLIDFSAHSLHNWSLFGLAHRSHLGAAHSYSTCSRYACECIRTPEQKFNSRILRKSTVSETELKP